MASPPALLTLPDVVAAVPSLLRGDYRGVRSGRVRDLPDIRTIRYYQSAGILDRPTEFRGRAALYGRRHLLQIAVVKKLQASGLSLADIQGHLPGATDAELARALGVRLDEVDGVVAATLAARDASASAEVAAAVEPGRRRGPFWTSRPSKAGAATGASVATEALQSKNLGASVVVLWNGRPLSAAESATLAELAAPLVGFLSSMSTPPAERGGQPSPSRPKPVRLQKEPRR